MMRMGLFIQRPLQCGADIVLHSATKYMNGHSDVVMGLLITNDTDLYNKLYFLQYGEWVACVLCFNWPLVFY